MELSALDMTAAETAPRPMNATAVGVKYCKTKGRTRLASSACSVPLTCLLYSVCDQSEKCRIQFKRVHRELRVPKFTYLRET